MARQAIEKPADSTSSSGTITPILTPPSPEPDNEEGGALLYDILQAFQKHALTDASESTRDTDTIKTSKGRKQRSDAEGGKSKVAISKSVNTKDSKATGTKLGSRPAKPLTTKRTTVIDAFNDYFGEVSQLANWQRLCADLDIEPMPSSITQCKKALKSVWVNIYDFLDAKAAGVPVKRFPSERALAKYTTMSGKIFPKKHAKKGGPARLLLAHIFRP